ncbi:MAG: ATP-binding protein [Bacteroidota bacterium]
MDVQELQKLVRQGEGQHLEFKLKSNHPEKIIREVVAFANTEGGTLLIGVSDNKEVKGLKFPEEDEYLLTKAIHQYCFPTINYTLEHIAIDENYEREVLAFHIPKSIIAPHYVLRSEDIQVRKVYVRVEDRSIQASKEMREVLKQTKKDKNFCFSYGEKEQLLMTYLASHAQITLEQFADLAQISRKIASRTLVLLVLANVLKIMPEEKQDYFVINPTVDILAS